MMEFILALALVFTAATQFRLPGIPIGPGELGLVVWIVGFFLKTVVFGTQPVSRAVPALLSFWVAFALALSIGMMTAMATREAFDPELVVHDAIAYVLVAVLSCLCAATPMRLRRVSWFVLIGGAVSLSLQLANGFGIFRVPGIDPWFWERFRGWSDNPNQLAILCLIIALTALYLAETATNLIGRLAAILLLIPSLVAGRLSQSDAFMLAMCTAVPVWIVVKLIVWLNDKRPGLSLRASFAQLMLMAAPALILCCAPLLLSNAQEVRGLVMGLAKNNGAQAAAEADLRITLWHQAIERGIESGMLGLGPGPHLHIPPSIVAGRASTGKQPLNLAHPDQNGTMNYEAHNTVLDVFTQGGLLAVASFIWIMIRATSRAYRSRSAGLVALIMGAAIFLMTGNIVRQPIFWFAVVLCLTARDSARGSAWTSMSTTWPART